MKFSYGKHISFRGPFWNSSIFKTTKSSFPPNPSFFVVSNTFCLFSFFGAIFSLFGPAKFHHQNASTAFVLPPSIPSPALHPFFSVPPPPPPPWRPSSSWAARARVHNHPGRAPGGSEERASAARDGSSPRVKTVKRWIFLQFSKSSPNREFP